jgi:hypothetical protein
MTVADKGARVDCDRRGKGHAGWVYPHPAFVLFHSDGRFSLGAIRKTWTESSVAQVEIDPRIGDE